MFNFFTKKKNELFAPVTGDLLPLERVDDPVFSQGMMGTGFAVEPCNGHVYSPVAAKVVSIFPTKHAFELRTKNGDQILLHLGIDTVNLQGRGFDVLVREGDSVSAETKLVEMNLKLLEEHKVATTVMVLLPENKETKITVSERPVEKGEYVATVE